MEMLNRGGKERQSQIHNLIIHVMGEEDTAGDRGDATTMTNLTQGNTSDCGGHLLTEHWLLFAMTSICF